MMNVNEIKKSAREHLKGKWKKVVLFVFCFIIVEYIINKIFFSFGVNERKIITNIVSNTTSSEGLNFQLPSSIDAISLVLFVVKIIIEVPLLYSFTISFMKFKRGKDIGICSFLENDNFQFRRAWKIEIKRISVLILPIILLLFISISTAKDYNKMIIYSKHLDTPFFAYMFSEKATLYTKKFIIDLVLLIICSIYYYTQKLKYILSYKIAFDEPELSAKKIIEKSKTLMIGHRKEYFIFQLSFIGWKILGYLTLGIGYLWITPYIQIGTVCFYDKLRENN